MVLHRAADRAARASSGTPATCCGGSSPQPPADGRTVDRLTDADPPDQRRARTRRSATARASTTCRSRTTPPTCARARTCTRAASALLPLVGVWRGEGEVVYPTIDGPYAFGQQLVFAHDGRPFLSYEARAWLLGAGRRGAPPRRPRGRLLAAAAGRRARGAAHARHRDHRDLLRAGAHADLVGDGDRRRRPHGVGEGGHRRPTGSTGWSTAATWPTSTSARWRASRCSRTCRRGCAGSRADPRSGARPRRRSSATSMSESPERRASWSGRSPEQASLPSTSPRRPCSSLQACGEPVEAFLALLEVHGCADGAHGVVEQHGQEPVPGVAAPVAVRDLAAARAASTWATAAATLWLEPAAGPGSVASAAGWAVDESEFGGPRIGTRDRVTVGGQACRRRPDTTRNRMTIRRQACRRPTRDRRAIRGKGPRPWPGSSPRGREALGDRTVVDRPSGHGRGLRPAGSRRGSTGCSAARAAAAPEPAPDSGSEG